MARNSQPAHASRPGVRQAGHAERGHDDRGWPEPHLVDGSQRQEGCAESRIEVEAERHVLGGRPDGETDRPHDGAGGAHDDPGRLVPASPREAIGRHAAGHA